MKISFNAGYRAFENQTIAYKRGISVNREFNFSQEEGLSCQPYFEQLKLHKVVIFLYY
jgi:hypothetical protein